MPVEPLSAWPGLMGEVGASYWDGPCIDISMGSPGLVCLWLCGLLWFGVVSVSGALDSWLVVVGLCVWMGLCFQVFSVSGVTEGCV